MRETKNESKMSGTDKWKKSKNISTGKTTTKPAVKPVEKTEPVQQTSDRHFVGGGWDNTGKFGTFLTLQLNVEKLQEMEPDEYGQIKVTVAVRKTPDEKSKQTLMVYAKEA